jgi:hypothetical protein
MNSEGKAPASTSQPKRPRCQPTRQPIEAGGSGSDRTIETHDQRHDAQRCVPHSMLNNRFLGVFRGQAPSIPLQLPVDTWIDAPGDQCPGNITKSASISQANFRISTERNTRLLIRPGKAEVPALDAFCIHKEGEVIVIREGVVLGTGVWRVGPQYR